jgi:hypothetical protein
MKTRSAFNLGLVAMAFILATAVTAAAAGLEDLTKAKVVRIKGSARYTAGTGAWQPLKVGDVLTPGTVVQTAADSRVDLVLGDPGARAAQPGSTVAFGTASPSGGRAGGEGGSGEHSGIDQNFVRMMENTVLSIDKLAATDTGADIVTDTQLDLRSGRIFGTVKKLSGGSRYEIKIPNGVAGVRGTIFELYSSGLLRVWEGAMALALSINDEINTWLIQAKKQFNPEDLTITDLTDSQKRELQTNVQAATTTTPGPPPPTPPSDPSTPYLEPTAGVNSVDPPMSPTAPGP